MELNKNKPYYYQGNECQFISEVDKDSVVIELITGTEVDYWDSDDGYGPQAYNEPIYSRLIVLKKHLNENKIKPDKEWLKIQKAKQEIEREKKKIIYDAEQEASKILKHANKKAEEDLKVLEKNKDLIDLLRPSLDKYKYGVSKRLKIIGYFSKVFELDNQSYLDIISKTTFRRGEKPNSTAPINMDKLEIQVSRNGGYDKENAILFTNKKDADEYFEEVFIKKMKEFETNSYTFDYTIYLKHAKEISKKAIEAVESTRLKKQEKKKQEQIENIERAQRNLEKIKKEAGL